MDEKFYRRFESFCKSLDALAEARQRDMTDSFVLSGTSAKFSITFDLAWKVMKDYEEYQGYTDVQGSRDAIRKALQMGIVEDSAWMSTISSRNLTSHCYDEEEFNMILNQIIHDYLPIFVKFSEKMNAIKASEV